MRMSEVGVGGGRGVDSVIQSAWEGTTCSSGGSASSSSSPSISSSYQSECGKKCDINSPQWQHLEAEKLPLQQEVQQ